MKRLLCRVSGHRYKMNIPANVAGGSTCVRSGHLIPPVRWPRPPARMVVCLLLLAFAVPGLAVDIPTPAGFTPWFSVDGAWVEPNVIIRPATESIQDGRAVSVIVVASNPAQASPPSDASIETLVVPAGTQVPVPGWLGPVLVRGATGPIGITFAQGTGTVNRYTVFRRDRIVYGACGKPGTPGLVP